MTHEQERSTSGHDHGDGHSHGIGKALNSSTRPKPHWPPNPE